MLNQHMAHVNRLLWKNLYPSDKDTRQDIVDSIFKEIYKNDLKPLIEKEELYLIIDEAITNAMEHGNRWDPKKKIIAEIIINTSHVYIRITDEGKGFNSKSVKSAIKHRNVLSTRGRGIYIISQFSETSWNDSGNQIEIKIKRSS